jgi:AraC family transcriptional activator of mtrCDE
MRHHNRPGAASAGYLGDVRQLFHEALAGAMSPRIDWLSRLLDMVPVRGHLDLRCFYGAPWRIEEDRATPGEIPYHVVLGGSAVLEDATGGPRKRLAPGDIVLLFHGGAHVLHDGSGASPAQAHERAGLNLTISENAGTGDRLDMLCGRFVFTAPHERLLRDYLPARLMVQAADHSASTARPGTSAQLAGLVSLMRIAFCSRCCYCRLSRTARQRGS